MSATMKPCPFCDPLKMELIGQPKVVGYGARDTDGGKTWWHGLCVACAAEGPKESSRDDALAAWNRRAGE